MTGTSEWLSTERAADALGVTVRTVYRIVNDGKMPAYKIGRVFRFRQEDIDEFLESVKVGKGDLDYLLNPRKNSGEDETSGSDVDDSEHE